jgi:multidrug efflux system membrane fusion protein
MAGGTLQVEVRIPGEPGAPRTGEVTFLDNAVQDPTGTVMLRATIPNEDRRLWPGQFVQVRLILSMIKGAIIIPAAAPQLSATGPYVYVIKEDMSPELRPVTLGQRQGDRIVVEKGLRAGERVVVTGHMGIDPKGKVRVEESPTAGTPPKAGN